jgi:hypothetical protein
MLAFVLYKNSKNSLEDRDVNICMYVRVGPLKSHPDGGDVSGRQFVVRS